MDGTDNSEDTPKTVACAHCQGLGSCRNGEDGASCGVCAGRHKITASAVGLVCGVCQGRGRVAASPPPPGVLPLLALSTAYVALGLVAYCVGKDSFHEVLAFAATLTGCVVGYFFAGRGRGG